MQFYKFMKMIKKAEPLKDKEKEIREEYDNYVWKLKMFKKEKYIKEWIKLSPKTKKEILFIRNRKEHYEEELERLAHRESIKYLEKQLINQNNKN